MWTRCPIVKVAMGCRTEPAFVPIAHVMQKLHFFQFFLDNLHNLPQKKNTCIYRKKNNSIFFYNLHNLLQNRKLHDLPQKKKQLHGLTIFLYTSYIFHCNGGTLDAARARRGYLAPCCRLDLSSSVWRLC